ncbi:MAG: hypothetical protein RIR26_572 [Pseudomonadota bacterium]
MRSKTQAKQLFHAALGCLPFLVLGTASCKPLTSSESETAAGRQVITERIQKSSAEGDAAPTPSAGARDSKQHIDATAASKKLTTEEWFSKKDLTPEEVRTVDALLDAIPSFGGPSGNPTGAARWASGRLDSLSLDGLKLTEIGPVLTLKGLVTLSLHGNKLQQEQIDALLAGLPNLRTLVIDAGLKCDEAKFPKVTCLH